MFPALVYGWWAAAALWLLLGFSVQLRRRGIAAFTRSDGVDAEHTYDAARRLGARGNTPTSDGEGLAFERDGRAFLVTASHFGKKGPTRVYLGTTVRQAQGPARGSAFRDEPATADSVPTLPCVVLRAETTADALGKHLGMNAEIQTGDAAFDDAIYVEHGGDHRVVADLLARSEVRRAVLDVVDARTAIVGDEEGQALALRWHPDDAPADPEALRAAIGKLSTIAEMWPAVVDARVRRRSRVTFFALRIGAVFFGALAMGLCGYVLEQHGPVDTAFSRSANLSAATLVLGAVTAAWVGVRRHPRGLARFFWAVAVALGTLPSLASASLAALNGWGKEERHDVPTRVVRAFQKSQKRGYTCHVELAPWRMGIEAPEEKIPCGAYGLASTMPEATVRVGRGRLGWEWIDSVELRPAVRP